MLYQNYKSVREHALTPPSYLTESAIGGILIVLGELYSSTECRFFRSPSSLPAHFLQPGRAALGKVQSEVLPVTLSDELVGVLRARFCITLHRSPLCPRQLDVYLSRASILRKREREYRGLQKHHRLFQDFAVRDFLTSLRSLSSSRRCSAATHFFPIANHSSSIIINF